jgi:hypothetical protein
MNSNRSTLGKTARVLTKCVACVAIMASVLTVGLEGVASASGAITEAATFPVSVESLEHVTLNINPQKVGDLLILSSQIHSQTNPISSVTAPGTGTWQNAEQYVNVPNNITEEIWYTTVSTAGPTTITVNYTGSITGLSPELVADSYTTANPATWTVGNAGGTGAASTTTITFPSVTSGAGANQLYWGYAESTQTALPGSTAGFKYSTTADGNLFTSNDTINANTGYAPTASETPVSNYTTIAAIFAAGPPATPYTVTFAANLGTGTMANETASAPTNLTINTYTRSGYNFTGWNTFANNSGTAYADGASYPFTSNTTLYAQWSAATPYTVTFAANLGTGTMANETASAPTNLTINAYTRSGYHFTGWNTFANNSGTAYADGARYPFTSNTTLYAQWSAASAISLVAGSTSSTKVGTTGAITVTSAQSVTSSANVLLAMVQVFGPNSTGVGTISDPKTGTWTVLGQTTVSGNVQFILWQCTNPQAGVAHAVTWTPSAADSWGALVVMGEWAGGPFTLDKMSSVLTSKATTGATPSVTPSAAGDLILASAADENGTSAWTSPTSGFTALTTPDSANVMAYLLDSATSAISTTWKVSPSDSGDTAIFALH